MFFQTLTSNFATHSTILLQAEAKMAALSQDKEYSPIGGPADFGKLSAQLALGDNNEYISGGKVGQSNGGAFP